MVYTVWLCSLVLSIPKTQCGVFSVLYLSTLGFSCFFVCRRNEECVTIQGTWGHCEVVSVILSLGHVPHGLCLPPKAPGRQVLTRQSLCAEAFLGLPGRASPREKEAAGWASHQELSPSQQIGRASCRERVLTTV